MIDPPRSAFLRLLVAECRRFVETRPRRWLALITALVAVLAAAGVTASAAPVERSFATASGPVQSLISITVPFLGALAASELHRRPRSARAGRTILAATALAVAFALFGALVGAIAVGLVDSAAPGSRWEHAGAVVAGSVVVQVIAQLVGTGLGLLLGVPLVAAAGTVVLPMGLFLALGAVAARTVQAWLTPYAAVPHLLSGTTSGLQWLQVLVIALIWGLGLNAAGARRLRRVTGS